MNEVCDQKNDCTLRCIREQLSLITSRLQVKRMEDFLTCWIFFFFPSLFFSQAVHIRKLFSRPRFLFWASVSVSSAIRTSSPIACCAPAPPTTTAAWTVVVEIVEVRWCVRGRVEVGLCMGSHHGVTPVGYKTHRASTPKSPPSCPGLRRSLASRTRWKFQSTNNRRSDYAGRKIKHIFR